MFRHSNKKSSQFRWLWAWDLCGYDTFSLRFSLTGTMLIHHFAIHEHVSPIAHCWGWVVFLPDLPFPYMGPPSRTDLSSIFNSRTWYGFPGLPRFLSCYGPLSTQLSIHPHTCQSLLCYRRVSSPRWASNKNSSVFNFEVLNCNYAFFPPSFLGQKPQGKDEKTYYGISNTKPPCFLSPKGRNSRVPFFSPILALAFKS